MKQHFSRKDQLQFELIKYRGPSNSQTVNLSSWSNIGMVTQPTSSSFLLKAVHTFYLLQPVYDATSVETSLTSAKAENGIEL